MDPSRNTRRKLLNLAYRVLAQEAPECDIERDSLRRYYPDTNYGLLVEFPTLARANRAAEILQESFQRRGWVIYNCRASEYPDHTIKLDISGFYRKDTSE
jgi:hypothetical protein